MAARAIMLIGTYICAYTTRFTHLSPPHHIPSPSPLRNYAITNSSTDTLFFCIAYGHEVATDDDEYVQVAEGVFCKSRR